MEWLIAIPIVMFVLLCPLMMIGMIAGGWIFGRRVMAGNDHQGGHSGHGMMCMMHGPFQKKNESPESSGISVAELKAERARLDELIERVERDLDTEPVAEGPRQAR